MTKKQPKESDFLTVEEAVARLDAFAAAHRPTIAEDVAYLDGRRRLRNVTADFRAYLEDEGVDPDRLTTDQIDPYWGQLVADAATRQRRRLHDPRRGPKVADKVILDAVKTWRKYKLSDSEIARRVSTETFEDRDGRMRRVSRSRIMACIKAHREK